MERTPYESESIYDFDYLLAKRKETVKRGHTYNVDEDGEIARPLCRPRVNQDSIKLPPVVVGSATTSTLPARRPANYQIPVIDASSRQSRDLKPLDQRKLPSIPDSSSINGSRSVKGNSNSLLAAEFGYQNVDVQKKKEWDQRYEQMMRARREMTEEEKRKNSLHYKEKIAFAPVRDDLRDRDMPRRNQSFSYQNDTVNHTACVPTPPTKPKDDTMGQSFRQNRYTNSTTTLFEPTPPTKPKDNTFDQPFRTRYVQDTPAVYEPTPPTKPKDDIGQSFHRKRYVHDTTAVFEPTPPAKPKDDSVGQSFRRNRYSHDSSAVYEPTPPTKQKDDTIGQSFHRNRYVHVATAEKPKATVDTIKADADISFDVPDKKQKAEWDRKYEESIKQRKRDEQDGMDRSYLSAFPSGCHRNSYNDRDGQTPHGTSSSTKPLNADNTKAKPTLGMPPTPGEASGDFRKGSCANDRSHVTQGSFDKAFTTAQNSCFPSNKDPAPSVASGYPTSNVPHVPVPPKTKPADTQCYSTHKRRLIAHPPAAPEDRLGVTPNKLSGYRSPTDFIDEFDHEVDEADALDRRLAAISTLALASIEAHDDTSSSFGATYNSSDNEFSDIDSLDDILESPSPNLLNRKSKSQKFRSKSRKYKY